MIKFSNILNEASEELGKRLADAGISLIPEKEFDEKGGTWISYGAGKKLYTLRSDWMEAYQEGEPNALGQRSVGYNRRSAWIANIAKSWEEVLRKLPGMLQKLEITKIYIPDYNVDLDPNTGGRHIVFDENTPMLVGKKHAGKTIGWVKENDPSYLVYLATHITSGSYEVKKFVEYLKTLMASEIKAQEESLIGDAVVPFGKYKGQKLSNIAKANIGYIKWLANLDNSDRGYKPGGGWTNREDKQGEMLQRAAREFIKNNLSDEMNKEKSSEEARIARFAPLIEFMRERVQSTKEWEQSQNFYDDERGGFAGFLQQLTDQLAKGQIPRGKAAEIVIDNYVKWFGGKTRRGTKEYERKRKEFYEKYVKGDEAAWNWAP